MLVLGESGNLRQRIHLEINLGIRHRDLKFRPDETLGHSKYF